MQTLNCLLIQPDLVWEDKQANFSTIEKLIERKTIDPNLIILPEMFTTGFSMNANEMAETMEGETVQWIKNIAIKNQAVVTGSCIIKENEQFYNRLVWATPNGELEWYDKRHLFGMGDEHNHYTAGTIRKNTTIGDWRVMPMICYDLRFPVWSRNDSNTDLLIYVANWPKKRVDAWSKLLQARAIENQCYVIGVNRVGTDANGFEHTGHSAVVDPMGHVITELINEEGVLEASLDLDKIKLIRRQLPFLKDMDSFEIDA